MRLWYSDAMPFTYARRTRWIWGMWPVPGRVGIPGVRQTSARFLRRESLDQYWWSVDGYRGAGPRVDRRLPSHPTPPRLLVRPELIGRSTKPSPLGDDRTTTPLVGRPLKLKNHRDSNRHTSMSPNPHRQARLDTQR